MTTAGAPEKAIVMYLYNDCLSKMKRTAQKVRNKRWFECSQVASWQGIHLVVRKNGGGLDIPVGKGCMLL